MDRLSQFLRTRFFILLAIGLIGCGYSEAEKAYLKELRNEHENFEFDLSDRVTNLELTVNVREAEFDSIVLKKLFYNFKEPLPKYPSVNWVYLIVKNNEGYVTSIGSDPRGEIFFFKGHEGQSKK